jgi:hypothetical protein
MDQIELVVCAASFLTHFSLFRYFLNVREATGTAKGAADDAKKLYSCYLSHIHCAVTILSCLSYWASRPVHLLSPEFMVEVNPCSLPYLCLSCILYLHPS